MKPAHSRESSQDMWESEAMVRWLALLKHDASGAHHEETRGTQENQVLQICKRPNLIDFAVLPCQSCFPLPMS